MALSDATCIGKNDIVAANGRLVLQANPGAFQTDISPFTDAGGNYVDGTVGQITTIFQASGNGISVNLLNPINPIVKGQPFATSAGPAKDLLHLFPMLVLQSLDGNGKTLQTCSIVGEVTPNEFTTTKGAAGSVVSNVRFSFIGYCDEDASKKAGTGCVAVGLL